MTSVSPTPPIAAPKPRRRRWPIVVLALIAAFVVGVFVVKGWIDRSLRGEWDEAEAEADRLDPGWRLKDMLAALEPIPDHENSALLILALVKEKNERILSINEASSLKLFSPNIRLNDDQVKLMEPKWTKLRESIVKAYQLKNMPRGRFAMAKPEEWEAFGKEDWKSVFTVADWLRCDAYLSAQQGKYQHAMESCLGILNTGESTKDVPGSMPVLTRLNVHLTMIEAVERVLAQGTAPDATLQTAQASLEKIAQENTYLHHVRNQRVWGNLLFVDVRDGKAPSSKLAGYASDSHAQWYNKYPSSLVYFYPRHLNHMNQLVEIAKAPIHERAAKLAAVESANPLADAVVLPELHEQVLENAGLVRSAIAALACERYCLARQQWPEDWNALIREKYLQEIPLDPVDGAPLRLRATDNGIVMYSIGKNGIDEKGDMPRHIGATAGDDQGFRLWDERFRGQPSMDRKNAK